MKRDAIQARRRGRRLSGAARRRSWPAVEALEPRIVLSNFFTVDLTTDKAPTTGGVGSGLTGDLRYCITQANADNQPNTIVFDSTVFGTQQTITLGGSELELMDTHGTQAITGPAAGVTIDAGGESCVLEVDSGVTATLSSLTLTGGTDGGLVNVGTITLTNCMITGISGGFGSLTNTGKATLTDCTISGNSVSGLSNDYSGTVALIDCTISGNSDISNGVSVHPDLGGRPGGGPPGGGGPGNDGYYSGGYYSGGYGGIANVSGTTTLTNTIVAGNSGGQIIGQVSGSYNLIGTGGSGELVDGVDGNLVGVTNPLLGTLGNYGGPTETIPLLPGSPAIDAGDNALIPPGVTTDQRGIPRIVNGVVDIGAFESEGFTLTPVAGSTPQSSAIGAAFVNPLTVRVTANNPVEPVDGGVITFVAPPLASGASAFLSASSVAVAGGEASVSAVPNNIDGSYQVTASAPDVSPVIFDLTNTGPVFAQLIVNTTSDSLFPGPGLLSLPEAVRFANFDRSGKANISFDSTVFSSPQTITLLGTELELSNTSETETITGPAAGLTIDAGGKSRVLQVDRAVTATLSRLTLNGGSAQQGGDLYNAGTITLTNCMVNGASAQQGGGLVNSGTITLTGCTISGNSAGVGGGVYDYGTATLTDCSISGNSSGSDGGLENLGTVTLTDCTISDNSAGAGGGLGNSGTATLTDCTLIGNSGEEGASLENIGRATITDCTISGNSSHQVGGGLWNDGTATITDCTISGNSANEGGGLWNGGTATITDCTISGNSANVISGNSANEGGALSNGGTATITDCTISGNSANEGGGLWNEDTATITDCTISGNSANEGGGLYNKGAPLDTLWRGIATATITDCTISGNSANEGGGVEVVGSKPSSVLTLTASTVSGNSASTEGGGIYIYADFAVAAVTISDTIVAGNSAGTGPDVAGAISLDQGFNLIGDGDGASGFTAVGDQVGTTASPIDPLLAPPGDYGGPTQTMPLLHGSPAIGKGVAIDGITTDQRGLALDALQPDIGAFQSDPLVINTTGDGTSSTSGVLSLRQAVELANVVDGAATITFAPTVFAAHQTIALTSGQLELSARGGLQTIAGPAAGLTIDAGGMSGVVAVDAGVTAALTGLTITGGSALFGGGLLNSGTITLTDCTLSGNSANEGGGVYNDGTVTLIDCTLSGNSAGAGGGMYNNYHTATITDCTVSGNSATIVGGGLWIHGSATLTDSTISGNSANEGGGVYLRGGANSRTTIVNTIVAGNAASTAPDLLGTVTMDQGFNLVGDDSGSGGFTAAGDQVGTATSPIDPLLAPLGNYGGPTQTIPLRDGSPAIGKGVALTGITTDQRGFALDSPQPDIGSFQSTLVVNSTSDGTGSTFGVLSLRQAVELVNIVGAGTITFDPTVFATHETISLTGGQLELSATGGLESIAGPAAGLTMDADGNSRVFQIDSGVTAALSGLTITGGSASRSFGAGLANFGTVTLTDCTVSGNSASFGRGGGLWNAGTVTLVDSTISGNSAGLGGGVYDSDGKATFTGCMISGNSASEHGGGVYDYGTVTLTDCTISGNSADEGGGVEVVGSEPSSFLTLTACTVSGNSASTEGGGIDIYGDFAVAGVTISDTIIAGNSAGTGPDVSGAVSSDHGFNLIGDGDGASGFTAAGDQVGTATSPIDPLLAPLGNYGGPTQTMALLPGSPAIGQGTTISGISADQRGFALDAPQPDIGAFQSNPLVVNTTSDGTSSLPGDFDLRQAIDLAEVIGTAATITFAPTVFAAPQTIALTAGPLVLGGTGDLLTIDGPAAGLTIDAGGNNRVVQIDSGVTAALSGLTITGGSAGVGGGLASLGTIMLADCTVSGNSADLGGGLWNGGTATLVDCTIVGNTASYGGGISNDGTATITDCIVSGNSANYGGGVYDKGTATLTDCTISGNSASNRGGGVCGGVPYDVATTLSLTACTVSANSAGTGGGVFLFGRPYYDVQATIGDTIVAGNTASNAPDFAGAISTDLGDNLIGDGDGTSGFTAAGDQVGTATSPIDPLLAPLGNYGGPTQTMALLPGSSAIGKGVAIPGIATDQRGLSLDAPRPDIGAFQSTLVVNTTSDSGYGLLSPPGELSLRQAIGLADFLGGTQTITFDPAAFATAQTIALTGGQLELSGTGGLLTIDGPSSGLTIDAGENSRVFVVDSGATAAISGLALTGGSVSRGFGAGLENLGTVTVTDCTISGNSDSLGRGGGLANGGTATLVDCTINGNSAGDGGGVYNNGTVTLTGCTISGNSANDDGGGVYNNGTATLTDCTISGNLANAGGGLWNYDGTATLANSTISGNSAYAGGGVNAYGPLTLTACTVSGNSAAIGGGVYLLNGQISRSTVGDTIVAGNVAAQGSDIAGAVTTDLGHNLIGGDPLLAPLGNYGGPTQTMALLPGSPAIGQGVTVPGITTDERGLALDSPQPDIGALQSQGFIFTPVSGSSSQSAPIGSAFANPLAVTVTAKNSVEPVAGGNVSFAAPSSGASAVLSSSTATIGSNGVATITATANYEAGSFNVTASATGVATPAYFALTNKQALLVIMPDLNQSMLYGSNLPVLGFIASGFVNGDGPSVLTGSLGTTATSTSAAGIYAFTLGTLTAGSNYTLALAAGSSSFTVTPATPLITWANPADIVYGTALSAKQLDATASWTVGGVVVNVTGSLNYAPAVGTVLSAGADQTLAVSFTPADQTDYNTASASVAINVDQAATTTALSASMNNTVYGQAVTFTATVAATTPGIGTPTGSVTFFEGSTPLGSVSLSGGVASLTVTTLPTGTDPITAIYSGDPNFTASTSTKVSQTVNQDATTTSVVASANPSVYGQSVTFTATISPNAPGGGTPTGTVIFMDGSTVLGSQTLSGAVATLITSSLSVSNHKIKVVYGGDSNFIGSQSSVLTQTVTKDATTTSVTSSADPSVFGQSVTFTATVAAAEPGSGTPTGTVTFKDGSTTLGKGTLAGGTASLTTASLAVATHSITVSYSGDADFTTGASTTLSQIVDQAGTTISLVSATSPSVFGQAVTFTADVSAAAPGSGTSTGKVTFYDGSTSLGTASLSSGSASFTAEGLPTGADSITASYVGSGNFTPSTSAVLVQTVNQATTTSAATSSTNPSVYGQSVTITATVTAVAPGNGTPTGSITFLDGSNALGTATLSGGKATFKTAALAAGQQTITVSYSGDGNFVASTSGPLTQIVNQSATTSKVTSSANPSVFGESVTFTATVTAVAPGSGTPTGSVTFMDGSTTLDTGTLSGGTATFSISTLPAAAHSITVIYGGDTNFLTSTSAVLTQTVKQAGTTSSVTSSANPSVSGQAVTFTATIAPVSPGSGTPTGSVTFDDGSTVLGTVALNNGTASFTTSSLAVATHSIKAVYAGDTNFKVSTSAVLKQVVNSSSNLVAAVTIAPNLVDQALSALGDETLTDALVSDLTALRTPVTRAKGASAALRR
jgi:fibronectin-binding autotransporter adhesin